jgi:[methyl-Co(III) methanol-specific corrinoid protein]:coenzyme M methyltransferase
MLTETMRPKDRVVAAMRCQPVDRAPVGNPNSIVTTDLQDHLDTYFPEAHLDAEKMARLAGAGYTILGYDTVMPLFSTLTSGAALGAKVDWMDRNNLPVTRGHIWEEPEDIVIPPDFLTKPSTSTALKALQILKREYGDVIAVVGKAYGAWSLAYHTFGIENFMIKIALEPDKTKEILHRLKEVPVMFGRAQIDLGIDVLNLVDHCSADLVGADTYEEFLMPIHQEIRERLGKEIPIVLHTCGRTLDRLPLIAGTGLNGFNIDTVVDSAEAKRLVGSSFALWGGVNNPKTLLEGSLEDVKADVYRGLDAGLDLIGPECAAPLNAPYASIKHVVEAVRDYYREGRVPGTLLASGPA